MANTFKISEIPQIQNIDIDDLLLVADKENGQYHSRSMSMEQVANTIYAKASSCLSNDGYALKSDIPSTDDISVDIHLSDYSLTSHNHDEAYLKEVPSAYKTYSDTKNDLSNDGYAKASDLSDLPAIKQDIIEYKTQISVMLSCLPLNKTECSLSNIIVALYSLKAQFEAV